MTRREIQKALKSKGVSQASLARMANVSPGSISRFIRHQFKSKKLSDVLAVVLGANGPSN